MPGFLGNKRAFTERYQTPIMKHGDQEALTELRQKVSCFLLRRTNMLYQDVLTTVRNDIFALVQKQGFQKSQIHILAALTKLRQVCNHPLLITKRKKRGQDTSSAKLDLCLELVEEIASSGKKVIIFSQFTSMLDIIAKELTARGIGYSQLTGKTTKRQRLVDQFSTDQTQTAFLISLKAGGTGLNITAASRVILFDPWWNPAAERQAIDRTHRMGQTQSVHVYRLITTGTIEEKILALQEKKQQLFDAMVDSSGERFKTLTWEDVQELFA